MQNAEQVRNLLEDCQTRGLSKAAIIEQIATACLGWPYVFGAVGEMCTPKNRGRRANSTYPEIKAKCPVLSGKSQDCAGCEWGIGVRMFDCRGFTYWLLQQVGITISTVGATTQWNTTQDWAMRGEIKNLPPSAVACVFKYKNGRMSHTGMHIGHGQIIHCATNVKRGKTTDSGWTHFAIPNGLYTEQELTAMQAELPLHPTLREGNKGETVRQMQTLLTAAGYSVGTAGADGIFGKATLAAVEAFQRDHGLTVDGVVGIKTWTALEAAVNAPRATYTVHIPGLDKAAAEAFAAAYDGAYITGEEG